MRSVSLQIASTTIFMLITYQILFISGFLDTQPQKKAIVGNVAGPVAHSLLSASRQAMLRCARARNRSSLPKSHEEMMALLSAAFHHLPLDMSSEQWVDILCPAIGFDLSRQSVFEHVYASSLWPDGNNTAQTMHTPRNAIQSVLQEFHALSSIINIPCGNLTWMPELFPFFEKHNITYTGVDIVPALIQKHRSKYPQWHFEQLDYVKQELPISADLIFSREALQHLNFYDVFLALHHFSIQPKVQYLLTTSYETDSNSNFMFVDGASNTLIQLDKSPYFFKPIAVFHDGQPGGINRLKLFQLPLHRHPEQQTTL